MQCSLIITSYFIRDFYGGKQFEGSYVDYAPGEVVVARYSVDLQWYRARVISSGDRKVEVVKNSCTMHNLYSLLQYFCLKVMINYSVLLLMWFLPSL